MYVGIVYRVDKNGNEWTRIARELMRMNYNLSELKRMDENWTRIGREWTLMDENGR